MSVLDRNTGTHFLAFFWTFFADKPSAEVTLKLAKNHSNPELKPERKSMNVERRQHRADRFTQQDDVPLWPDFLAEVPPAKTE